MFNNCENLKSLNNIFKWNVSNVYDMSYMFCGCTSLKYLGKLSKWNIAKLNRIEGMEGFFLDSNIKASIM